MRKTLLFILLLTSISVFAQKNKTREYALGVNFNSNSYFIGGLDFKIDKSNKFKKTTRFLQFEIANIKHPNEVRKIKGANSVNNPLGNKAFVLGKSNYLYALRAQIGFKRQLFKKASLNGVGLNLNIAEGIVMGFNIPYFINYQYSSDINKNEAYNSQIHTSYENITGSSGPFSGLGGMKLIPGLNTRISLDFEFGENRKINTIIEAGFLFEGYTKRIEIIEGANQQWFFSSVFLVLYFGK